MKKLIFLFLGWLAFSGIGCQSFDTIDDNAVDDAIVVSALSQGDGDTLTDVSAGDATSTADEEADAAIDQEIIIEDDCSLKGIRERVLNHYDQNGDGKINLKERVALTVDLIRSGMPRLHWGWHYRLLRLTWVYDADDSGMLSKEERQARRSDLEMRCENRLEQFLATYDTDKNGSLNQEEWKNLFAAVKAKKKTKVQQVLARYDRDGDGKLNWEERSALVRDLVKKIELKRQQVLEQFDADGDGKLNADEKARLREYLRSRIRGETLDTKQ